MARKHVSTSGRTVGHLAPPAAMVLILCTLLLRSVPRANADAGTSQPAAQQEAVVKIIDAQGFVPNTSGGISNDPGLMQPVGNNTPRIGAVADGTSVLVIKATGLSKKATISLQLTHTAGKNYPQQPGMVGSLWAYLPKVQSKSYGFPSVPAPDPSSPDTTTAVQQSLGSTSLTTASDDSGMCIFYYRPPNNFFFGKTRDRQKLVITDAKGILKAINITLYRPSIILAHGVCSDPSVLDKWKTFLNGQGRKPYRVEYFGYQDNNTSGVDVLAVKLQDCISKEIAIVRSSKIAETRVDYCAHSYGGFIAKWYAENLPAITAPNNHRRNGFKAIVWNGTTLCNRPGNFGCGDFHRVITVGAPLQGSPLADGISATKHWRVIAVVRSKPSLHGDGDAADDLGATSPVTQTYLTKHNPDVQWYPLVGQAAPGETQANLIGDITILIDALHLLPSNFGLTPANSDCVVLETSQLDAGGAALPAQSSLITSVVHTQETSSPLVWNYSKNGLDLNFDSPSDHGFKPGYSLFNGTW